MDGYTEEELKKIVEEINKELESYIFLDSEAMDNINIDDIESPVIKEIISFIRSVDFKNMKIEEQEERISKLFLKYLEGKISFDRVVNLYNNKEVVKFFCLVFSTLGDNNQSKLIDLGIFPYLMDDYKGANALNEILNYTISQNVLEKKVIDLLESVKNNVRDVVTVWKHMSENGQEHNLTDVIKKFKDSPKIISAIWINTNGKIQEENDKIFPEIMEAAKNDDSLMPYIWINTSSKLQEDYSILFPDVVEVAKSDTHTLTELWVNTSQKVKEANLEIFPDVVEAAKSDLYTLTEIWKNTSPKVQEASEDIFSDIIKSSGGYFKELWENTSSNIQSNYFHIFFEEQSRELIKMAWRGVNEDVQQKYIKQVVELLKEDNDGIVDIWCGTSSKIKEDNIDLLLNIIRKGIKGDRLYNAWMYTNEKLQDKILGQLLNENNETSKVIWSCTKEQLESIWRGTKSKIQEKYIQDIIRNNPDISEKLWENTEEIVQEKYVQDIVKSNPNIIEKIWIHTRRKVQENNQNIFHAVMEKVNNDGYEMFHIWLKTSPKVQMDNEKILPKIAEAIKDSGALKLEQLWMYTERKVERKMLIQVLDKLKNNSEGFYAILRFPINDSEELFNNFSRIYFMKTDKELTEKTSKIINNIYKNNKKLFQSLNFEFISKEEIINNYSEEQLLRMTNYIYIQDFIVKYYDNPILIKGIDYLMQNHTNWIISFDKIIKNQNEYEHLLKNMPKDKELNVNDEIFQQFLSVISEPGNYFEIMNYDDVKNFYNKKNEICLRILNGDLENLPGKLKDRYSNKDDLYKFALLEYKFGINLDEAKMLVEKYGEDIEELPEKSESEYLGLLKEIIDCDCIQDIVKYSIEKDNLKQPWEGFPTSRNAEGKIINMFADLYNQTLYNPKETDKSGQTVYIEKIKNENGKVIEERKHEIPIYTIKEDFNLNIRVEGAYFGFKEPENFVDYYEVPDITYHGNCESYIGNDSIALARNRSGVAVGYGVIRHNSLIASATYDMGSNDENVTFSSYNSRSHFRTPKQMIDNTRDTHNEMVKERLVIDENGNVLKNKPDYAVWIKEHMEEDLERDTSWIMTKKLAAQLGIPIVIIDREYFAKREMEKIEVMKALIKEEKLDDKKYEKYQKEYENLTKPELIREIITKFENNRTGMQFSDLRSKYFTQEQIEGIIDDIVKSTEKLLIDEKNECFCTLYEVLLKERISSHDDDKVHFYSNILDLVRIRKEKEQTNTNEDLINTKHKKNLFELYMKKEIETQDVNMAKKELKRNITKANETKNNEISK